MLIIPNGSRYKNPKGTQLNDFRSELSLTYLRAIVNCLGGSVRETGRTEDKNGIDATCEFFNIKGKGSIYNNLTVHFQLKSTSSLSFDKKNRLPLKLPIDCYKKYRGNTSDVSMIMTILLLPPDRELNQWLEQTEQELILKRCMYWVSLYGAPEVNQKSTTIYFPKHNVFTPESLLKDILIPLSRREKIPYEYES